MERKLLLFGGRDALRVISKFKDPVELATYLSKGSYYWEFIDTDTNTLYSSYSEEDDYSAYNMEDINLSKNIDFVMVLMCLLDPCYDICNYTESDLDEYFLKIASNEKVCTVVFESIITDCKRDYLMDRILRDVKVVNPILYKRLSMELKLRNVEWMVR